MKKGLFIFSLVLIGLLFSMNARADYSWIYYQDFQNYSTGTLLSAVPGWTTTTINTNDNAVILNNSTTSGSNAVYFSTNTEAEYDIGATTSNGFLTFDFFLQGPVAPNVCSIDMDFRAEDSGWTDDLTKIQNVCAIDGPSSRTFTCGEWHTYYRRWVDGICTEWVDDPDEEEGCNLASDWFGGIWIWNRYYATGTVCEFYIDMVSMTADLNYSELYGITVDVVSPYVCADTETYEGIARGYIESDEDSSVHWTKIIMQATDIETGSTSIASTTIDIVAGDDELYEIYYDFATGSAYYVAYRLEGHNIYSQRPVYYAYSCESGRRGMIGDITKATLEDETCYDIAYEDCSTDTLSVLEKFSCNIVETTKSIYIPSCEYRLKLQRNVEQVKERVPFNFIIRTKDFLIDIGEINYTTTSGSTGTGPIVDSVVYIAELDFFVRLRAIFLAILYIALAVIIFKILKGMFK